MLFSGSISPATDVLIGGEPARDRAVRQAKFADECERWLDHWYRGSAQRERLQEVLISRGGIQADPRKGGENTDAEDTVLTEDGRIIRAGVTELVNFGYARKVAQDLGVLYASDDLERLYLTPKGEVDKKATATLDWYNDPARGALDSWMNLLDAWLVGLRCVGLRAEWVPELGEIHYEVLPPHWFHIWPHDRFPRCLRLAYAIAFAEPEAYDEKGKPIAGSIFTAYVRPALATDPPNAPTRMKGYERAGRLVRYQRKGHPWAEPFPLPDPDSERGLGEIVKVTTPDGRTELYDYPNWLVEKGGWAPDKHRFCWCPIVVHYAEPPVEGVRLPVADHHSRTNEELDVGLSMALHTANEQLFGQPVYRGAGDPPRRIGPSYPVHVQDAHGSFTFEGTAAEPDKHLDVLHKLAKISGSFEHLPADTFDYQPPSIETGPAKLLRRAELIQERSRRAIPAVRAEVRTFELVRVIHNAFGVTDERPRISDDTRLEMHWGELAVPVDWGKRLTEMAQERDLLLTSHVDLVAERHGVSREEAKRRLREMDWDGAEPLAPPATESRTTPPEGEPADGEDVEATPADVAREAVPPDTALNGAQVTALLEVVEKVVLGMLPRESAVEILSSAFPIDRQTADKLLGSVGKGFEPPTSEPAAPDRPTGAAGGARPDRGEDDEVIEDDAD